MYSWSWNIKLILILLKYNIIYCYHWNIILHIINISTEYSIKLYKISKYLVSRLYFLTRFQEVHSLARSSNQFQKTTFQVFFSFPLKCSSKIYSWPSNLDYLSLSTTSLSLSHFLSWTDRRRNFFFFWNHAVADCLRAEKLIRSSRCE